LDCDTIHHPERDHQVSTASTAQHRQGTYRPQERRLRAQPDDLHVHAIGHGWRASSADILRNVAERINAERTIQGMKTAPSETTASSHRVSSELGCGGSIAKRLSAGSAS
jgi:hypothetical protein